MCDPKECQEKVDRHHRLEERVTRMSRTTLSSARITESIERREEWEQRGAD